MHTEADSDPDEGSSGDIAQNLQKIAKATIADKAEKTSLLKIGFKKLASTRFRKPSTGENDAKSYRGYLWAEHMRSQVNRIVHNTGITQTREQLEGGGLEDHMFKEPMTNDDFKNFEDEIATLIIGKSQPDTLPPALADAKGVPHIGLPLPPMATKNPERAMVSLKAAAQQLNVALKPMSADKISETFTALVNRSERIDRCIRVALNEMYSAVGMVVTAAKAEDDEEVRTWKDVVEQTHEIILEAMAQAKLALNKEFMVGLGLKLDLNKETRATVIPFETSTIIQTDVNDQHKTKKLKEHLQTGIMQKISNRPGITDPRAAAGNKKPGTPKIHNKHVQKTPTKNDQRGADGAGGGRGSGGGGKNAPPGPDKSGTKRKIQIKRDTKGGGRTNSGNNPDEDPENG